MKALQVPKIRIDINNVKKINDTLDSLPSHKIETVNWPEEYPSKPEVLFQIAHNSKNMILRYEVREDEILGVVNKDGGEVWTDSCVEMFLAFDNEHYYNLECNCIGSLLLRHQDNAHKEIRVYPPVRLSEIKRYPSLGDTVREKKKGDFRWTLLLIIPDTVFNIDRISSFDGLKVRGNFYKCGDNLTLPHFLSWNKIDNPKPNFHLPQFFGEINFE